jgi:hypothetical protein
VNIPIDQRPPSIVSDDESDQFAELSDEWDVRDVGGGA